MHDSIKKLIDELVEYTENGDIEWEAKDGAMVCGKITVKPWEEDNTVIEISVGVPVAVEEDDAIPLLVAMIRAELMWKKSGDDEVKAVSGW